MASLIDGKFEMILCVLERIGDRCGFFLSQLNKIQYAHSSVEVVNESALGALNFELSSMSHLGEAPSRQQLEHAAYKIASLLDWPFFASRIKKIDEENNFGIFKPTDPLLVTDIEFFCPRFRTRLPPSIAASASFHRASFARKMSQIEGGVLISCENVVDAEVLPRPFSYIRSNVYSHDDVPRQALEPVVGCQCRDGQCSDLSEVCCPDQATVSFAYRTDDVANTLVDVDRPQAIYECNSLCCCPPSCPNRVVQNGLRIPLLLFKTQSRGWGVKTLRDIREGEFVIEFVGEVIAESRLADFTNRARSFCFVLDFNVDRKANFVINAHRYGNLARFINSRCVDGNLSAQAVYVDCLHSDLPRIAFFAKRDIASMEELTFDYFDGLSISQTCLCGSNFCRENHRKAPTVNPLHTAGSTLIDRRSPSASSEYFSLSSSDDEEDGGGNNNKTLNEAAPRQQLLLNADTKSSHPIIICSSSSSSSSSSSPSSSDAEMTLRQSPAMDDLPLDLSLHRPAPTLFNCPFSSVQGPSFLTTPTGSSFNPVCLSSSSSDGELSNGEWSAYRAM